MPCSFEDFELRVVPSKFYRAGFPRARAVVLFVVPFLFVPLVAATASPWLVGAGYVGLLVTVAIAMQVLRRARLAYWSRETGQPIEILREADSVVQERIITAVLSRFDTNLPRAHREVTIELSTAEELLNEARLRKEWPPRWVGAAASAVLAPMGALLSRSTPQVTVLAVLFGVLAAAAFLVLTMVVDLWLPPEAERLASYVRILRLAKRNLELQLVQKDLRPAA